MESSAFCSARLQVVQIQQVCQLLNLLFNQHDSQPIFPHPNLHDSLPGNLLVDQQCSQPGDFPRVTSFIIYTFYWSPNVCGLNALRQPTMRPSRQPVSCPTTQPSRQPTRQPTLQPSQQPTTQVSSPKFSSEHISQRVLLCRFVGHSFCLLPSILPYYHENAL